MHAYHGRILYCWVYHNVHIFCHYVYNICHMYVMGHPRPPRVYVRMLVTWTVHIFMLYPTYVVVCAVSNRRSSP